MVPSKRIVSIAAGTILAALIVGVLYFWYGESAPEAVDIEQAVETQTDPDTPAGTALTAEEIPGDWEVSDNPLPKDPDPNDGTFVGFRLEEELFALGSKTAVGRTHKVGADITITPTHLTAARVTADLSQMTTDDQRRDLEMKTSLDVWDHPTAVFVLIDPVRLPPEAFEGKPISVNARGNLTIKGKTLPKTVSIQAETAGDRIAVTGTGQITMSEYNITPPSGGRVFSVSDQVTIEWQLLLEPV
jgi:polyisoprenoid-binding protein YceI